MLGAKH